MSNITSTKLSVTIAPSEMPRTPGTTAPSEHLPHIHNPKFKAHANCDFVIYPAESDNHCLKVTNTMRPNDEVLWSYENGFNLG